jgi:hypothetical protein
MDRSSETVVTSGESALKIFCILYSVFCMISRAGWLALAHEPWRDISLIPKGTSTPDDAKWSVTEPQCCPLCGKKRESPYHFFIDCLHAEIVAARAAIREQLRALLPKLAEAIVEATKLSQLASRQHMSMMYSLLQTVKDEFRAGVPVEDFLLYRMLLVLPHPAFLSSRHAALGALFDWARILHPQASKPANLIARWATASIRTIAAIRLRHLPPGYYDGFKEQVTRIKEARKRESKNRTRLDWIGLDWIGNFQVSTRYKERVTGGGSRY